MSMTRLIRTSLAVVIALTFGACASGGGGATGEADDPAGEGVSVQVNNDYVPSSQVTVWMVPESGSRRRLGTIPPNGRQTFNYSPNILDMDHHLLAEVSGGQNSQTTPFTLVGVSAVRWDISSRNATVIR